MSRFPRVTPRQAGALAVAWLVMAVFFAVLYRFADDSEHHAYNTDAVPPSPVTLSLGKIYQLSTMAGQSGLAASGQLMSTANCIWQTPTGTPHALAVTALPDDSGSIHVVGTFVGPANGPVQITCTGLGPVFVDDAESSGPDLALVFVLISAALASAGAMLGIWALYAGSQSPRAAPEVEPDDPALAQRPTGGAEHRAVDN
jgi:hypothetical protein